jgi:hypothetical protein
MATTKTMFLRVVTAVTSEEASTAAAPLTVEKESVLLLLLTDLLRLPPDSRGNFRPKNFLKRLFVLPSESVFGAKVMPTEVSDLNIKNT